MVYMKLCVSGCDDRTTIKVSGTVHDFAFLKQVARSVTDASSYGCMPKMSVKEITREEFDAPIEDRYKWDYEDE